MCCYTAEFSYNSILPRSKVINIYMVRQLQIFQDGTLSELEDDTIVKGTDTKGQVHLLIEALQRLELAP